MISPTHIAVASKSQSTSSPSNCSPLNSTNDLQFAPFFLPPAASYPAVSFPYTLTILHNSLPPLKIHGISPRQHLVGKVSPQLRTRDGDEKEKEDDEREKERRHDASGTRQSQSVNRWHYSSPHPEIRGSAISFHTVQATTPLTELQSLPRSNSRFSNSGMSAPPPTPQVPALRNLPQPHPLEIITDGSPRDSLPPIQNHHYHNKIQHIHTLFQYLFGSRYNERYSVPIQNSLHYSSIFTMLLATTTGFLVLSGASPPWLSYFCVPYMLTELIINVFFLHFPLFLLLLQQFQIYFLTLHIVLVLVATTVLLQYDSRVLVLAAWVTSMTSQMLADARMVPIRLGQLINFMQIVIGIPLITLTYTDVFQLADIKWQIGSNTISVVDFFVSRLVTLWLFNLRILFYRLRFPGCLVMIQAKLTNPVADQFKPGEDQNKWTEDRVIWRNRIELSESNALVKAARRPQTGIQLINVIYVSRNGQHVPLLPLSSSQIGSNSYPMWSTRTSQSIRKMKASPSAPLHLPVHIPPPLALPTNATISENDAMELDGAAVAARDRASTSCAPAFAPLQFQQRGSQRGSTMGLIDSPLPLGRPPISPSLNAITTEASDPHDYRDITDESLGLYRWFGSAFYHTRGINILRLYISTSWIFLVSAQIIGILLCVGLVPSWTTLFLLPALLLDTLNWIFYTQPRLLWLLLRQFELLFLFANGVGIGWSIWALFDYDERGILGLFFLWAIITGSLYDCRAIPQRLVIVICTGVIIVTSLALALLLSGLFSAMNDQQISVTSQTMFQLKTFFAERCVTITLFALKQVVSRILHPGCFTMLTANIKSPFQDQWILGDEYGHKYKLKSEKLKIAMLHMVEEQKSNGTIHRNSSRIRPITEEEERDMVAS